METRVAVMSIIVEDADSVKPINALAGKIADRYLLRHETATKSHYERLHLPALSFDNRMRCLYDLRKIV